MLGSSSVYFQPPSSTVLSYPAIVYNRDRIRTTFADNKPFSFATRYQVTVIDRSPKGEITARVARLPMCTHDRFFVANGLNHDVFTLYY